MKKRIAFSLIAGSLFLGQSALAAPAEEKITFTTGDGQSTEAYAGSLMVPENRANPDSRLIPVKYVRFPATGEKKGPPIVYLAGGPGGSGIMTAKYRRYGMFMAMRAYGDVIALDQRGTGASDILPECRSHETVPATEAVSDETYVALQQAALRECLDFWKAEGVDIAGYNTVENARDIDALRQHLGADRLVLWGISYGSHLAFAAMKEMGAHIDRVVLSSAEGLDQTVKLPARTDAYFDRLQQAVDSQPAARAAYGDIKAMMRRVHAKLEANPVMLHLKMKDGSTADLLWQRRDMQQMASGLVADPRSAAMLLAMYFAMDHGITAPFEEKLGAYITPGRPITLDAMSTLTDIASGMTAAKKAQVAAEAKSALLKDWLNFSYHYDGIAPALDLGDAFRDGPYSDVPTLLFSGTLDGRTYIESQHEAVAGIRKVTTITVENAGHNLYMTSPEVQDAINRFMEGKAPEKTVITIALPDLAPPKG
ncbi:MAG: alpha/beta hydrolase [Alphaproteobacteria bacterium]|nr:MAG: alpha/beta hydrolase [Alphaproteobacteria bacterium]